MWYVQASEGVIAHCKRCDATVAEGIQFVASPGGICVATFAALALLAYACLRSPFVVKLPILSRIADKLVVEWTIPNKVGPTEIRTRIVARTEVFALPPLLFSEC